MPSTTSTFRSISVFFGALPALIGAAFLITVPEVGVSWPDRWDPTRLGLSRWVAVAALSLGAALLFIVRHGPPDRGGRKQHWKSSAKVLIGISVLVTGWALASADAGGTTSAGWSAAPAVALLLSATTIAALGRERWVGFAQVVGVILLVLSYFVAAGLILHSDAPGGGFLPLFFPTCIVASLSIGVLLSRTDRGWASILADTGENGRRVRTLLLPATLLPLVISAGISLREGPFDFVPPFILPLLATTLALGLALAVIGELNPTSAAEREMLAREQALREAEVLNTAIIDASLDAIITVDQEGKILAFNQAAERTFGWSGKAVIGRQMSSTIIPHRLRQAHESAFARYIRTEQGEKVNRRIEMPALHADGTEFPVELAIIPVRIGSGLIFTAFLRDIRERLEAESRLRRSVEEKDILLREVHHRVKNNLQMICSLLTLQARREEGEGVERAFGDAVGRIRSIALLHERIYATNGMTHFHLGSYLGSVVSAASASLGMDPSVAVVRAGDFRVGSVLDTAVPCGLIVTELVTNAIKHGAMAPDGARILITADTLSDGTRSLLVEDGGGGLTDGFDKKGTLGVELVTLLTQQLRGTVAWGTSESLGGARVEVRLPPVHLTLEGDGSAR